jgi:hypothetical protein
MHFFIFMPLLDFDPPVGKGVMNYQNQSKFGSRVILVWVIRI